MRDALSLARRGVGKTDPNPAVGCILVKDGKVSMGNRSHGNHRSPVMRFFGLSLPHQVVGQGFHPRAGMPHAEVYALRAAGKRGFILVGIDPEVGLLCRLWSEHRVAKL